MKGEINFHVLANRFVKYTAKCPDREIRVNWSDCDTCFNGVCGGNCDFREGVKKLLAVKIQEALYK